MLGYVGKIAKLDNLIRICNLRVGEVESLRQMAEWMNASGTDF